MILVLSKNVSPLEQIITAVIVLVGMNYLSYIHAEVEIVSSV